MATMTREKKAEIWESLYEQHPSQTPKQRCEKAILGYLAMREREYLAQQRQIKIIRGGKS